MVEFKGFGGFDESVQSSKGYQRSRIWKKERELERDRETESADENLVSEKRPRKI